MRSLGALAMLVAALSAPVGGTAVAAECENPNALGVSRTLTVDPAALPLIGTMSYRDSLPLGDHEVVLTFDDGPLPRYTEQILNILASECVKATYFMVGHMASAYPEWVRKVAAAGHTIGTHSQNHPLTFHRMALPKAQQEIDQGFASVQAALGEDYKVAPFFRYPGLLHQANSEAYLAQRGVMAWSADFPGDDWKRRVNAKEVTRRSLSRLEAKGHGVLLLHDIHQVTVTALPNLLAELKARGYKIVHVIPGPAQLKPAPGAEDTVAGDPAVLVVADPAQAAPLGAVLPATAMATSAPNATELTLGAHSATQPKAIAVVPTAATRDAPARAKMTAAGRNHVHAHRATVAHGHAKAVHRPAARARHSTRQAQPSLLQQWTGVAPKGARPCATCRPRVNKAHPAAARQS